MKAAWLIGLIALAIGILVAVLVPSAASPGDAAPLEAEPRARVETGVADEGRSPEPSGSPSITAAAEPSPAPAAQITTPPSATSTDGVGAPGSSATRHPQTASVIAAATSGDQPQRLTPLVRAGAFDRAGFADPSRRAAVVAEYLSVTEPGRIHDTHPPGPGVLVIECLSAQDVHVAPGERHEIVIRSEPFAPVSLHSFGLGAFPETGLTSITVAADAEGLARVAWEAIAGTVGDVVVAAASPLRSGSIRIHITVGDTL